MLSRIQTSDRAHVTARDCGDSRPWREIVCAGLLFWLKRLPTPEKGIQANLGVNAERAGGPCPSNSCFGGEVLGRPGCAFVESCQGHDLGQARADLRESAKLAAFSASPLPSTASWGQKCFAGWEELQMMNICEQLVKGEWSAYWGVWSKRVDLRSPVVFYGKWVNYWEWLNCTVLTSQYLHYIEEKLELSILFTRKI